jgi:hypothetical protein
MAGKMAGNGVDMEMAVCVQWNWIISLKLGI